MMDIKLEWHTEKRKISELLPYDKNPRILTDRKRDILKKSLEKFGFVEIPVINLDGVLIAGHQRCKVMALIGRGNEDIDVRVPNRQLTDNEFKEYNVTRNVEIGQWNREILELDFSDIDLEQLGISIESMSMPDEIINSVNDIIKSDEDEKNEVPVPINDPIIKSGDLFQLGEHRLLCGDSTIADDVIKVLGGNKPNLMLTDPPYGVNYDPSWREGADLGIGKRSKGKVQNDDIIDWSATYSLFEGDVAYVWHAGKYTDTVAGNLKQCGFDIISQIIWAKQHFVLSRGDYHWKHEPCWYAVKKGKKHNWQGARDQSTVWDIKNNNSFGNSSKEETFGHGTQKPLECMERPIRNNTETGGGVYDPFLGSGTTLIAAEKLARKCYGIEIAPNYCEVIILRYCNYMKQQAKEFVFKHINGDLTIDSIIENNKNVNE